MRRAAALALALALGLAAAPAAAEVRRFEVVGAVALDPAKPLLAPRQAALKAALQEAVARAAQEVARERSGQEPGPGEAPPAVPGEPTEYAVSYRVIEDRGEQEALLAGGAAGGREYVVVAEVQIDVGRVREALGSGGTQPEALPASAAAGPTSFRLELLGIPSPAVWTAIRRALARAGAASVVPVELEPGRAIVQVESGLGADRTLERLLQAGLPAELGLGLEPLPEEAGTRRLQVREGIAPQPPPEPPAAAPVD